LTRATIALAFYPLLNPPIGHSCAVNAPAPYLLEFAPACDWLNPRSNGGCLIAKATHGGNSLELCPLPLWPPARFFMCPCRSVYPHSNPSPLSTGLRIQIASPSPPSCICSARMRSPPGISQRRPLRQGRGHIVGLRPVRPGWIFSINVPTGGTTCDNCA